MSRQKAAASNPFLEEESGSLEAYLEGKDEVVVDSDGKPTEQADEPAGGDEEAGTPAESGADAEAEDGDEADDPDGNVEELKRKLQAERRAKKALAKRIDQIERNQQAIAAGTAQHLQASRDREISSTLNQADQRVVTLDAHVKAAQQARRAAFESGDADQFEAADAVLNTARERLSAARQSAVTLKQHAERARQQPVNIAAEPSPQARDGEAKALAKEWLQKPQNRWFIEAQDSDDGVETRMASNDLIAKGILASDPRHWALLERRLRRELPHRYKAAQNGRERNGAPTMVSASERGGGQPRAQANGDGKEITRAEVKAWAAIGKDIVNNKADRDEFTSQRTRSRAARNDPNRLF